MKQLSREQRLARYSVGAKKGHRLRKRVARARALHEHTEEAAMHVGIRRHGQNRFSVVLKDDIGRLGIIRRDIPSYSVARQIARQEGFDRGIRVFNMVEDAIEHGRAGAKSHIASFL